ncbi:MAG: NAD-dependent epimerase/dehydratase family protein [Candidatus Lokiarchaeia archaeon]
MTGVAGFIGSNITDFLLENGSIVIGIDNLLNGKMENLNNALQNPNFTFYKVDIRDKVFMHDICKGINIIFHEAAFASVPDSIQNPITCNNININGTLNILESARRNDINSVIFASSGAVYGDPITLPMKETMNTMPISPYGVTKLTCEKYLSVYSSLYGFNTISLRYLNVYGPGQDISPYSGVISKWLGQLYRNEHLVIYGDGEQKRDFIYIKDIILANILAAKADNLSGNVFNIGTGNNITINKLANIMKKLWGNEETQIKYTDERLGDIKEGTADVSKAKKLLNFNPEYNLESGLKDYINWFKKNKL